MMKEKTTGGHEIYLKPFLVLLIIALIVFIGAKAVNEIEKSPGPTDVFTINISGEGKILAKPDVGKISVAVTNEEKAVSEAQAKTTKSVNEIIDFLKTAGVLEKDMKTTGYSIAPNYDYVEGKQVFRGYEVRQSLEIKIRDLDKAGEILAGVAERGANLVGGLQFVIDDEESLKAEAREKAIVNAKEKAETLAKKLGVRLGRVISFGEYGYLPTPMMYKAEMMAVGGAAPEIPTGENEITVNVSISYEIK